jgi:predicted DNA-binding transcriptional regulator
MKKLTKSLLSKLASRSAIGPVKPLQRIEDKRQKAELKRVERELKEGEQ